MYENDRVWHAGVSLWAGRSNSYDAVTGIELINLAQDNNRVFEFFLFHPEQIDAVSELATNITKRSPDRTLVNIGGRSGFLLGEILIYELFVSN